MVHIELIVFDLPNALFEIDLANHLDEPLETPLSFSSIFLQWKLSSLFLEQSISYENIPFPKYFQRRH